MEEAQNTSQDLSQERSHFVEKIGNHVDQIISKKKELINKELEEKISIEKQKAHQKISEIEQTISNERGALISYQTQISEFDAEKEKIVQEIRKRISSAVKLQPQISTIAEQTLQEFKKINDLNQKLVEKQKETVEQAKHLKNGLEEKYGVVTLASRLFEREEETLNLENELTQLKLIKDLMHEINEIYKKFLHIHATHLSTIVAASPNGDLSTETDPQD